MRTEVIRLYDKDVRAADQLLHSGEAALQALRRELAMARAAQRRAAAAAAATFAARRSALAGEDLPQDPGGCHGGGGGARAPMGGEAFSRRPCSKTLRALGCATSATRRSGKKPVECRVLQEDVARATVFDSHALSPEACVAVARRVLLATLASNMIRALWANGGGQRLHGAHKSWSAAVPAIVGEIAPCECDAHTGATPHGRAFHSGSACRRARGYTDACSTAREQRLGMHDDLPQNQCHIRSKPPSFG